MDAIRLEDVTIISSPKYAHKRKFIHAGIIDTNMDGSKFHTSGGVPTQAPLGHCDISEFVALEEMLDLCLVRT